MTTRPRVFAMSFGSVYPLYVAKAERKGRTREEVDRVITWLTGYRLPQLRRAIADGVDLEAFFAGAPAMNPAASLVTGVVCGVRVEEVADPLMRDIRRLDKLVDELAAGRALERILRQAPGAAAVKAVKAPRGPGRAAPARPGARAPASRRGRAARDRG